MRIWRYLMVLVLGLAGCVPLESQATSPDLPASPVLPTIEATRQPVESTATLPPPTPEPAALGSQEAVQAALHYLAAQMGLDLEDIQVLQVTAVEWPDACLGIPAADEMCAQVITPGYMITLAAEQDGVSEYFTFHTDASGGSLRVLPAAVLAARQALSEQTGIPLEQIRLVRIESIEWRNSCMGVTTPGLNCMDVIVPGYLIVFEANGRQYEYHTNQDGSRVVPASGLVVPTGVLLTWTSLAEPCVTIEVGLRDVRYGACGSQLALAGYYLPQRQAVLESFARLYASFETQTASGIVSLGGLGLVTATPAEMRMLAEWGSLVYGEAGNSRDGTPLKMAIRWHQEGGIAGFCDDLGVYRTGFAILTSCREGAQNLIRPRLDSHQLEMLYGWIDSLASFEFTQTDPAAADALFMSLEFAGQGTEAAGDDVQQAMLDLVAELFLQAETPVEPAARAAAEQILADYLAALREADYAEASALYGGSYEIMLDHNPAIDPADHAALFEAACTINGAVCNLSLRSVVHVAALGSGIYRFTVELQDPAEALFELWQCCTDTPDRPPYTQFAFLVEQVDGRYRVMTVPVYAG
jgi:hypothetical protein